MSRPWACCLLLTVLVASATWTPAAEPPAKPAEPPGGAKWPLWDGQESVADYARRTWLEPTKTIDLGNGVKVELVLIPAGKFIMGTERPKKPDVVGMQGQIVFGQSVVVCSAGVLLVMLVAMDIRAMRVKRRLQYSLARLVAMVVVLGAGVLGGTHWYAMTAELARAKAEYQPPLVRYREASDREKPAHDVTISKPFYLGKYEVTQEQYQQVMGTRPSYFSGVRLPVEVVSWDDAQEFCNLAGAWTSSRIRLPTEAEWEYACRAGTQTMYHSGDAEADLGGAAWYKRNGAGKSHPVGTKKPNAWGLYDMHGNVWEWCQDWCGDYPNGAVQDPQGADNGTSRALRGGAWIDNPSYCRSAYRSRTAPDYLSNDLGFRIVLDVQ